jgi:hypothetical protein
VDGAVVGDETGCGLIEPITVEEDVSGRRWEVRGAEGWPVLLGDADVGLPAGGSMERGSFVPGLPAVSATAVPTTTTPSTRPPVTISTRP